MSNRIKTAVFVCSTLASYRKIPGMVGEEGLRSSVHYDSNDPDAEVPLSGIAETLKTPRPKKKGGRSGDTTVSTSTTHVDNWFKLLICQHTQPLDVFLRYRASLDAKKDLTGVTSMNEYVRQAIGKLSQFVDMNAASAKTKEEKAGLESAKSTLENLHNMIADRGGKRSNAATKPISEYSEDFSEFSADTE